jgi:hypothetical protein
MKALIEDKLINCILKLVTWSKSTGSGRAAQGYVATSGSQVPVGAIADHIRIDYGKPVFFPGTYSAETQGGKKWGMTPPYCDQFYFIHMT